MSSLMDGRVIPQTAFILWNAWYTEVAPHPDDPPLGMVIRTDGVSVTFDFSAPVPQFARATFSSARTYCLGRRDGPLTLAKNNDITTMNAEGAANIPDTYSWLQPFFISFVPAPDERLATTRAGERNSPDEDEMFFYLEEYDTNSWDHLVGTIEALGVLPVQVNTVTYFLED